ncbi:MAG: Ig-like domain-containing protein [Clostridia bacterium]|nr:Ig-like domain-containing protein [Clostridia bacterium]
MKIKRNTVMSVLAAIFALSLSLFAAGLLFKSGYAVADGDDPSVIAETDEFVKTAVKEDNAVVLTATEDGVTATGNQTDDRTVVVFDHAYIFGSKLNFTVQFNPDASGTGSDGSLKEKVYSALYFAQATKTEEGFSASDFYIKRSAGNGMFLHLFTNACDLQPGDRSMINVSTFTKKDIVNVDSLYGGMGDGAVDLGWAYANGKPFDVEIGTEKVGGEEKIYFKITIVRGNVRTTVFKVQVNKTDLMGTANDEGFYVAFETANLHTAERAVSVEASKIDVVEAGLIIEPEDVFLKPTQTATLTVKDKVSQDVIAEGLTFASDNAAVATVNAEGKITAVKAGSAKITVSLTDGRTGEVYATVADGITLSQSTMNLSVGQTARLSATTNPTGLTVLWESDNEEVATVDNGIISAVGVGTATVKATVKNFETGNLEISAIAAINVSEYVKPDDIHDGELDVAYSDTIITGGSGYSYSNGTYVYNGTVQNGYSYLALADDLTFDSPVIFDFINKYDVSNTDDANHTNRFFGISIVQGDKETLVASDYAAGSSHGLQINFSSNGGWWAWGGKFFMHYTTSVSGEVNIRRTPENTGSLTGTDAFANAFCRAFAEKDGARIQVKIWKADDKLKVSFTPVLGQDNVPDGTEGFTYPGGGNYDFIGPYTMSFDYASVATGEGNFALAVGTGNTISGTVATFDYTVGNLDVGLLNGVSLNRTSAVMKVGDTLTLTPVSEPSTYVPTSTEWTTSDSSVAVVSVNGEVAARGAGTAVITCTVDGLSATCTVLVIESLIVESNEVGLKVGKTYTIKATTDPEGVEITYASSDERVATVNSEGVITAVAEGTATIYVKAGGELFVEEIEVNVGKGGGGCDCGSEISGSSVAVISAIALLLYTAFIAIKRKIKG